MAETREENGHLIAFYLDERLILFLDEPNKEETIAKLIEALDRAGKLKDKAVFHRAILEREKLVSTGIGLGVALPHAKLPGYKDFFLAIGIHRRGVEWGSIDGMNVRLIFLIGGPEERQADYLQLLSHLTAAVRDEERRKKLLQSQSAQEIISIF